MTLITFKMLARPNLCVETMIAKALELGCHQGRATRAGKKINRPDQKKGG